MEKKTDELNKANARFQKTIEATESASKAKSDFLAAMSHEIRTPLNGVVGMTSLLRQTDLTNDQRELVQVIESSGESVVGIVNDILDYSKIEAGRIELETLKFSLRECIELALDIFIEQVAKKKLELAYYMEEDVPEHVSGDPARLRQVLVNLIGNAVKFTSYGHITVSVSALQQEDEFVKLKFEILDTGIGIAPEKQKLLFKTFSQVDVSNSREFGGTGLGLAISKKLVELMGGEIVVKSNEQEGSKFSFTTILQEEEPPYKLSSELVGGKRILIVEDSDIQRKLIRKYLNSWGVQPVEASTSQQAIEMAMQSESPIDLAIIDYHLPDMNGNALAAELKKIKQTRSARFVSVTASTIQTPCDIFSVALSKPIKPRYMLEALERALTEFQSASRDPGEEIIPPDIQSVAATNPLKILLVDDNDTNRQVARMLLRKLGYTPEEAINGEQAIEMTRENGYDVILMDVQMPVIDGRQATRAIREEHLEKNPWIVAVTAGALRDDMEQALKAGMDDYLSKPILLDTLKNALLQASEGLNKRCKETSKAS